MSKSALKKQQAEIKKLVKEALTEKRSIPTKQIKSEEDLRRLASVISEYMESYILLGYDMEGNAINVCSARTQQHVDSLTTLLNNVSMSTGSEGDES